MSSVIRPVWAPESDEQRRLIAAARAAVDAARESDSKQWDAIKEARDAGVPLTYLANDLDLSRATIYRKLNEIES